jgi:hypothetical protein
MFIMSVGLSSGTSDSDSSMQKLCSFARQFTKAITFLIVIFEDVAHQRIPPHLETIVQMYTLLCFVTGKTRGKQKVDSAKSIANKRIM